MTRYVIAYVAAAIVMAALDAAWLSYASKAVFGPAVGSLFAAKTNYAAAIAFYVLYIAGVVVFAIMPAWRDGYWTTALMMGAAVGFFAYMTYDFTNMATLKVWPLWLAAIDMAWGTLVTAVAATAGYVVASRLA